jgi:peptidoglycan/LPS O-acetylase OafA/YrhL
MGRDGEGGLAYQPALDGVRAVAVLAVLLFHGGVAFLPGGFLGVDAFFVLSGFLITSLLLAERAKHGRIRLGAFWGRRARRLLPALLVLLVVVALVARVVLPPFELTALRWDELAALGYAANWRMIYRGGDYFTQTSAPSAMQHTWSLGIEEQFYLLWPLIVVIVLAISKKGLLAIAVGGAAASAVVAAATDDVNRAYFGTDTRAQALLIGCAAAILLANAAQAARPVVTSAVAIRLAAVAARQRQRRRLGVAAALGAATFAVLLSTANGEDRWLYHGGLTVAALAVAAVIVHAVASPTSPTARALAFAPLVWLGRISYGVYLWHWPLFQFVNADRTGLTGPALLAVRIGLTFAVAAASYVLVERPIRHGRWPRPAWRPATVGVGVVATAAVAVVATVPPRQPPVPPLAPIAIAEPKAEPKAGPKAAAPRAHVQAVPMERAGRRPGREPRVEILGDSVAWTIGTYLPEHPGITVTTHAIQGCGITLLPDIRQLGTPHQLYSYCPRWPSRYRKAINADDPDVVVLLVNRWELMDAELNGQYRHVGEPDFDAYQKGQLNRAIDIATARGAHVALLTAAYTRRAEAPDGGLYPEDRPERVDAWNALLRQVAAARPTDVTVLDLNEIVCPRRTFAWRVDGVQVRSDGLHFTPEGVQRFIAPWLLPRVARIAAGE